jgi:hypothetical protein
VTLRASAATHLVQKRSATDRTNLARQTEALSLLNGRVTVPVAFSALRCRGAYFAVSASHVVMRGFIDNFERCAACLGSPA